MPPILLNAIFLIVGLTLLVKGSDWFVDGSSNVAKACKIPSLIIGLTIVAFGTSAPEAAVSITASLQNSAGVALGNVIGSNIFNLLMVIGISSCVRRLKVDKDIIRRDYPFNILITFVIVFMVLDMLIDGSNAMLVSRTDGLLLLSFFVIYMYYLIAGAVRERNNMEFEAPSRSLGMSFVFLIIGLACIIAGGQLTVNGACGIARVFGVSENMIALTIVAVGTSLPELVTSVAAVRKGESDIAIGNVVGSNIFNILFILGMSATIKPLTTDMDIFIDSFILLAVTFLVYGFILKNKSTGRKSGSLMIIFYIAYAVYVVLRGIN